MKLVRRGEDLRVLGRNEAVRIMLDRAKRKRPSVPFWVRIWRWAVAR